MRIRNGNKRQEHMTARPSKYPQKGFAPKGCRWCGSEFSPLAPSHLYCSDDCKDAAASDNYYRKTYGVPLSTVESFAEEQGYTCAICQKEGFKMRESHTSSLNVDHCHKTGKVRGLLCHNCNRALGLLGDDVETIMRAVKYLESATTIP